MNGRVEQMHSLHVFVWLIYNRIAYYADKTVGVILDVYAADTGMKFLYSQLVW